MIWIAPTSIWSPWSCVSRFKAGATLLNLTQFKRETPNTQNDRVVSAPGRKDRWANDAIYKG